MKSQVSLFFFILGAAALLFISSGAPAGETQMGSAEVNQVEERKQLMLSQNGCGSGRWGSRSLCGDANEDAISDTASVVNEEAQSKEFLNADKQKRKCKFGCCSPSRVGCLRCCPSRQLSEVMLGVDHEANKDVTMDDDKQIVTCRYRCCRFWPPRPDGQIRCQRCCRHRKHSTMVREDTAVEKPRN